MNPQSAGAAGLIALLASCPLLAQENPAQRHEMATNQLKRLALEMSAGCLNDIHSLDDWKKAQPKLRQQLLEMLGLDPLPKRTPLKAQITGRLDKPSYQIEKIVFQSLPGLYVTGNFYLPKGSARAVPTVLYLCGHSPHLLGAKYHYQDRAIWFAAHGYPCLVLDTLEFGEVAGVHHGTHDLNMWHWFSLGYTPAGVEVWNAIRALDYLETRPEVDPKRIGLTGISGGGAMTWYTAAVDERIAAAAPVCSTFTWGSQADHWVAHGQCDCIFYNNTYAWDFPILAALIAPRPLLILSGQKDTIFPPDGYHPVFQRGKKIYDLYAGGSGADSERIREVDDNVEHSDPPLFLREARQWMQRWLKGDATPLPLESNSPPKTAAEDLACLAKIPADAINFSVHNQFTMAAPVTKPTSRATWERRRAALPSQLKEKVFRWFPTDKIPFETKVSKNTGGWHVRYGYADYKECSFQREAGVRIRAQVLPPKTKTAETPLLLYIKRAGDSFYSSDVDELLPLFGRYTVVVLNPRLTELAMGPAEYADVERTATWVGRTIAAMHVWDILRTVEWAVTEEKLSAPSLSVYAKGEMGAVALYAALFDDRIKQVILNQPPATHWQAPALLNVLRVTDLAEVAGALAPRRLVSLTKFPDPFEQTRAIYRLQHASNQFVQSPSLPEALEVWKYPGAASPPSP
ncbi:MAG TPA: acetylxylan esterase [Verrucomicrobiae bacterium]|nr:acetylxylan esterase [Verrucomicrobiae bacterium]